MTLQKIRGSHEDHPIACVWESVDLTTLTP